MKDDMSLNTQSRDAEWSGLLRRANRGDQVAYVRFLRDITPVLRGMIASRGARAGPDDHEDILQNTLIAIHEKRHTWREDQPVSPWLYAIARYKTADHFRAHRRQPQPFDGRELLVEDDTAGDPTAGRDVDKLLVSLDDTAARLVRDVKLKGLSAHDAGAPLGMSAGAVRVALHRAMARLTNAVAARASNTAGERKKSE